MLMGRPPVRNEIRRVFWRKIREGASTEAAAAAAGVSESQAGRWFAEAGGMAPMKLCEPSGRYLSFTEREEIAVLLAQRRSVSEIARRIGRPASTISREVSRNTAREMGYRGGRPRLDRYRASKAQAAAEARARRPKPAKLAVDRRLREYVQDKLDAPHRWSPEQIAARLRVDFPHDESMRVSHETIYQSLYVQSRGALRRELTAALRTGRAIRRPRQRAEARGSRQVPPELMISARPPEVEDRAVPGHWEGDLILGAANASAVATLVERRTRYVLLGHLPGDHSAATVRDALAATITTLPEHLRRSLTWDQGTEMALHADLKIATGLDIYFCDPHSPWQRGSNENTNGLLRQYLPKGSDLSAHTSQDLAAIAAALNGRPRKTLQWRTPAEALNDLLTSPPRPPVATTP
jgi:transposase, IS30 family